MPTMYNLRESVFLDWDSPLTWWEKVKLVLLLPLLPLKIVLLLILLSMVACINSIACMSWPLDQPLTPWRRRLVVCTHPLAQLILLVLGFHVRVTGWSNIKKAEELGAIGVFNHTSATDALVLFSRLTPAGVARQATATMPFIGHCIRALRMIYVPESRRRRVVPSTPAAAAAAAAPADAATANSLAMPSSAAEAAVAPPGEKAGPTVPQGAVSQLIYDRVHDPRYCKPGGYPLLVIAPEGTVTNGHRLLPFKAGAFAPGRPVVPLLLDYSNYRHLNTAWTEANLPFRFVRLMCQFVNRLEIRVLPPYIPSQQEVADPLLYAENVRKLMAKELGVGLSDDSFANCQKLGKLRIETAWDGRTLSDPYGVVGPDMMVDLDAALEKVEAIKAAAALAAAQAAVVDAQAAAATTPAPEGKKLA